MSSNNGNSLTKKQILVTGYKTKRSQKKKVESVPVEYRVRKIAFNQIDQIGFNSIWTGFL